MSLAFHSAALAVTGAIAALAVRKQALSPSGGLAALAVGYASALAGARAVAALLCFFVSSTLATRVGRRRKRELEPDYQPHGRRTAVQVLANGGAGALCALAAWAAPGNALRAAAERALLAHYACCNGDTWASELGVVWARTPPRLVLPPWRVVPRGTNGGVTLAGVLASAGGGAAVGAAVAAVDLVLVGGTPDAALRALVLGTAAGVLGSLIDSVLGATVQLSVFDPKRRMVLEHQVPGAQHISGVDLLGGGGGVLLCVCVFHRTKT